MEESEIILEALLRLYLQGSQTPLHFFPEASLTYARALQEKGSPGEGALLEARNAWTGNPYVRGESEDDYYRLCFDKRDPLDEEFRELALKIYTPLLRAREEANPGSIAALTSGEMQ